MRNNKSTFAVKKKKKTLAIILGPTCTRRVGIGYVLREYY
jgi:hypothetical protein